MIELLASIIIGLAVWYIGYMIGRMHGFEAGRENALDQMANRQKRSNQILRR